MSGPSPLAGSGGVNERRTSPRRTAERDPGGEGTLTLPPRAGSSTPSAPAVPNNQRPPAATPPVNPGSIGPVDWLRETYGAPEPQECNRDSDCGTGCCVQIGNQYRKCYPDSDNGCHLRWVEPPPSFLPRWSPADRVEYTGSFEADLVTARITEVRQAGRYKIFKLDNGQYWEELAPRSVSPSVGDPVRIAPSPFFYSMDAGADSAMDLIGVMQLPVVADTAVMGPFSGMEMNGIYALMGAGYWRVFHSSASTDPWALLTSPNNVDFWLYTEAVDQGHVDPAHVFADGDAVTSMPGGFTLDDGSAWQYVVMPRDPVPVGARTVVYRLALFDDRRPDEENQAVPYAWHEGGMSYGEWVVPR